MASYVVSGADLTSVADAIREKGGTSAQLAFPAEFVSAIEAISGGGGGTALSNPPIKAVSGTFTLASAAYQVNIPIDSSVVDIDEYILWNFFAIMPDEFWADYEGNDAFDNYASGLFLSRPQNAWPSTLVATSHTPMFYTPNANDHSWKSGGSFEHVLDDNSLTVRTAGNTYKFLPGVEYRYIAIFARRRAET